MLLGWVLWCSGLAGCNRAAAPHPQPPADSKSEAASGDGEKLQRVTLQLNWYPEAEHGGYYAAQLNGDYRRAGLDVTILPGGPETPIIQLVARGNSPFGVANADNVLIGRAQQAPVVAVMAPLQTSPRCLIVHEAAGIRGFDDLKDMTLAMSNSQAFSFFLRKKLPLENVRIVPYSGSVAPFLQDAKYGLQGYVFSEPFVARKQGGDPHVLMVSDLKFNPYTSLLITNEETIDTQGDLVRKMVEASVAGWAAYLKDPGPTNELIHKLNPQMDMDILEFGAKEIVPLVEGESAGAIGRMTPERWQELADQMIWCEQLKPDEANVDSAFSTKFLPQ